MVMDFWKYLTEGKGQLLPEELELPVETSCTYLSSQGTIGGQELIELGFPDAIGRMRQSYCSDPIRDALSSDQIGQEKDAEFGVSGSVVESGGLELATIDFKLGVLADSTCVGVRDGESSKDASTLHSRMPSVPRKKAQLTGSYSQTPTCQVHGCNKDLSSYKDYYKKHKVCDPHTKTAKVIVKGIEQRFCQQCSRFHLLAEFDVEKRSCRKRLANHNERRRKPRGTRVLRFSSLGRTSFLLQETLPTAFSGPSEHESGKWFGHMKLEDPNLDSSSSLNFHDNNSLWAIDKTVGITTPSDKKISHISDSSRALSLLSSQSQNPSDQLLETAVSTSQGNSEKIGPSGFHSAGWEGPTTTVASNLVGAGINIPDDGIANGSNTSNSKHCLSSGQGTMVDLMQLSSHLQMVEHKRKLMR